MYRNRRFKVLYRYTDPFGQYHTYEDDGHRIYYRVMVRKNETGDGKLAPSYKTNLVTRSTTMLSPGETVMLRHLLRMLHRLEGTSGPIELGDIGNDPT